MSNLRFLQDCKLLIGCFQLFDQSGGAASGTKQDAVSSAGGMIMKLMMKQQMGSVCYLKPLTLVSS